MDTVEVHTCGTQLEHNLMSRHVVSPTAVRIMLTRLSHAPALDGVEGPFALLSREDRPGAFLNIFGHTSHRPKYFVTGDQCMNIIKFNIW